MISERRPIRGRIIYIVALTAVFAIVAFLIVCYVNRTSPGLSGMRKIQGSFSLSIGQSHSCWVNQLGKVFCWGRNRNKELGDGTDTDRYIPEEVRAIDNGVISVGAGEAHTCILLKTSEIKCWGDNQWGQLGRDPSVFYEPVSTFKLAGFRACKLAVGGWHVCAVTEHGRLFCWGRNEHREVKWGADKKLPPVMVKEILDRVSQVSLGLNFTCALTKRGRVFCWGTNRFGQLGRTIDQEIEKLARVRGLPGRMKGISCGDGHCCAIPLRGQGLWCWGDSSYGQVGNASHGNQYRPVKLDGLDFKIKRLALGARHSCALTSRGDFYCWGDNSVGQLGVSNVRLSIKPLRIPLKLDSMDLIAAGSFHSCAYRVRSDKLYCWGTNNHGELGIGIPSYQCNPVKVPGLPGSAFSVSAGLSHTCVVTVPGEVYCWGKNTEGELGDGSGVNRKFPIMVTGLPVDLSFVKVGWGHSCVLSSDGRVWCWGRNYEGQIGDGSFNGRLEPMQVTGLPAPVERLSIGGFHSCAMTVDGEVFCWGRNIEGEVGDGSGVNRSLPTQVELVNKTARSIITGPYDSCALLRNGSVECWGMNLFGELGIGKPGNYLAPVEVGTGWPSDTLLALGGVHSCRLNGGKPPKCWGRNDFNELGGFGGSSQSYNIPRNGIRSFSLGLHYSCLLDGNNYVQCWGRNRNCELGVGRPSREEARSIESIKLKNVIKEISSGFEHACAIDIKGDVWCWGDDSYGQVGTGRDLFKSDPTEVVFPK